MQGPDGPGVAQTPSDAQRPSGGTPETELAGDDPETQRRNIWDFVTAACVAAGHDQAAPSLLPGVTRAPSLRLVRA